MGGTAGGLGTVGGAAGTGFTVARVVAAGATTTSIATFGGAVAGGLVVGAVAHSASKKLGWYEIDCSINQ